MTSLPSYPSCFLQVETTPGTAPMSYVYPWWWMPPVIPPYPYTYTFVNPDIASYEQRIATLKQENARLKKKCRRLKQRLAQQ